MNVLHYSSEYLIRIRTSFLMSVTVSKIVECNLSSRDLHRKKIYLKTENLIMIQCFVWNGGCFISAAFDSDDTNDNIFRFSFHFVQRFTSKNRYSSRICYYLLPISQIYVCIVMTFLSVSLGFRLIKTKLDFVEPAMTIWSGNSSDLMRCGVECAKEQYCVSLLYDKTTGSCKLFSVLFDSDESGNIDYWILNQESTRWGKLTYRLLQPK